MQIVHHSKSYSVGTNVFYAKQIHFKGENAMIEEHFGVAKDTNH